MHCTSGLLHALIRHPRDRANGPGAWSYFIRTKDDLIKIGWTSSIADRHTFFGSWDCILTFYRGNMDDEQREHDRFMPYLARGREYFAPHAELFERINEIRADQRMPPVKPWGFLKPRSPISAR